MDYKEANDYELISLIREQNEKAQDILMDKYKNIIKKYVEEYRNIALESGLDENDLYQEGLIGLSTAITGFNESKEASFYTFACICIDTRIKTMLRKAKSKKHSVLNTSLSLDSINRSEEHNFYEIIGETNADISEELLKIEEQEIVLNKLNFVLTPFEKNVLILKLNSYNNKEIAKELNRDRRAVENAMSRIRVKYKQVKEKSQ